jgi:hypothetical protein
VTVPANIGITVNSSGEPTGISALHTHDPSGIIHVESPEKRDFTLGQFFTEWGVPLTATQLGQLPVDATHPLRLVVNGQDASGNPADHVLQAHEQLTLVYGPGAPPALPSTYQWEGGQ